MTGPSTAKEFHRLMKRIGRLTDGQASIDNVDWDEGTLNRFCVTIRPNASYYKGGRFKFTIEVPDDITGEMPGVWCDTDIYHPNIDRHETKYDRFTTNICLNVFGNAVWDSRFGLEGVVIGILFLMHNPNISDPLSPEFDGGSIDKDTFAKNVQDYMAGKMVEDEYDYDIDFRVIDGEFKDLSLIENNANEINTDSNTNNTIVHTDLNKVQIPASAEPRTDDENETKDQNLNESHVLDESNKDNASTVCEGAAAETNTCEIVEVKGESIPEIEKDNPENAEVVKPDISNTETNEKTEEITDYMNELNNGDWDDDDDDEEVIPIRFVVDEDDNDYYVIDFGVNVGCADGYTGHTTESADLEKETVDQTNNEIKDTAESDINIESCDIYDYKRRRSETISHTSNTQRNGLLARSISVPNDFHPKHNIRLKPVNSEENDTMSIKQIACLALQCIFTVYRNML